MAKTYNSIPTVSTGDVYTATAHNNIVTNVNNYRVPCACSVYSTATQSIPQASTAVVAYANEFFDTDAMHDNATNNSRITITTAGIYIITATAQFAGAGGGAYRLIGIRKYGTTELGYNNPPVEPARGNVSIIDSASVNDYYEVIVYQNSGSALNLATLSGYSSIFSVAWVGQVS